MAVVTHLPTRTQVLPVVEVVVVAAVGVVEEIKTLSYGTLTTIHFRSNGCISLMVSIS
jgi:hypothetical protein